MKPIKRRDGWWITGCEPYTADGVTYDEYGPYDSKVEAQHIIRGLTATMKEMASKKGRETCRAR